MILNYTLAISSGIPPYAWAEFFPEDVMLI